jgi:two-component system sensor histidine kinase LytS
VVADNTVGTLKLYYRNGQQVDRTQLTIARGFANLLSAQLSSYELDRQAELTAQAEVKALQAQINPHFLFNTLNTIAALTRTDPTRARELLREFSVFYRRTLESSESRIPLSQELEQTRRYLTIERARFGEDRIVESEHVEPGLESVMVPSFLVQPIVENSVRHAMRDDGPLHIDVHVATDGRDVLIAVADDGLGMDDAAAERLLAQTQVNRDDKSGTGIALRNVAERIERFYGVGSGIEIMSKLGQGTVVTLRLGDAVPTDMDGMVRL